MHPTCGPGIEHRASGRCNYVLRVSLCPVVALLDTPSPEDDLDGAADLLRALGSDGRLVHLERFPGRLPRTAELRTPLSTPVREALGVTGFWQHQAGAIDLLRDGRSVVIATGTGSGKSLCYQAPIAEAATAPVRSATSLLLYPTKALAQDQLRAFLDLRLPRLVAATYDGDTSAEHRTWVRNRANVVLTNPEMLHHGLLPHHARWARFFARLRYVVVDELHVFRGIFGTHMAHVLRRLRRLCAHYGSSPTFAFTSATIGEPGRLARDLCGLDVEEIVEDGSPRGERLFALWNPPMVDEHGTRASAGAEAATVAAALVRSDRRTIVFCRSRKGTELLAADLRRRLPSSLRDTVRPYRSGYLPEERRRIEDDLFEGRLRAVVATSALELGIDVAGLDACVLNGFPGTVASLWQQAGRAGRAHRSGVTVLVAGDDQLDQWLMRHPQEVFRRAPEPAVINPSNPFVLHPHLECAAFERPLTAYDERYWPDQIDPAIRDLVLEDRLVVRRRDLSHRATPFAAWNGSGWPSHRIGLRASSSAEVKIVLADDPRQLIGTVDRQRAPDLVHAGAVYLHQGVTYRVVVLDLDEHVARVEPCDGDEYTVPRSDVSFRVMTTDRTESVGMARLHLGSIEVASQVVGYQRFDTRTRFPLGRCPLDLEPSLLRTRAVWYTLDDTVLETAALGPERLPGALHAIEHAAIGLLPLFTICDRWDVGGVSTARHSDTGLATITIYDGHSGGAGIAELAFEAASHHLAATLEAIENCPCSDGCPSCVQSPKCGNGNEPLDKDAARQLLVVILRSPKDREPAAHSAASSIGMRTVAETTTLSRVRRSTGTTIGDG